MKLASGFPGTASFVYGGPHDSLVIEFYDYSPHAESCFGNDVAFLIHVDAEHKSQVVSLLRGPGQPPTNGGDEELLSLLQDRFRDYFEVKRWLDENGIPYRRTFDGRA
jgi:hypothetical protein